MKVGLADPGLLGQSLIRSFISQYYWVVVLLVLVVLGLLAALAWWVRRCRHGGRYEYTALEDDSNLQERLELERKAQRSAARERAHSTCQTYLRSSTRYVLLEQLNDIGSRLDKHWFLVRDTSVKTERLLTLVPRTPHSPIPCNPTTRNTLLELFLALQHPYIYPVLDLDFREIGGQAYVITVLPFNGKGSLKDLIYRSRWQDDWSQKYGQRSAGLPISQVQRLGRQILEALLFLRDRGFPPCGHLHSGNIILQNGVARLTGLENTLLGYTSRIHPIIWTRVKNEPSAIDTVCFGHILFEMCAGYELCTPQPMPSHLLDIQDYPQVVQILDLIFHNPQGKFPSIEEISVFDFFRNLDLREMRSMPLPQVFQARLTPSTVSLLNDIKRQQNCRRGRRSHSSSTTESPLTEHPPSEPRDCSSSIKKQRSQSANNSQGECEQVNGSPTSSLYTTPQASLTVLDGALDEDEVCEASAIGVDSNIGDIEIGGRCEGEVSPTVEHRRLTLHIQERSRLSPVPSTAQASPAHMTMEMTSCLTRRIPSTT